MGIKCVIWLLSFSGLTLAANLNILPSPRSWTLSGAEPFDLDRPLAITVDSSVAFSKNTGGMSLIPPTLLSFAETFANDLHELYGYPVGVHLASSPPSEGLWLTITPNLTFFADGSVSNEGYSITSTESSISVTGSTALGAFWGTRSILQAAILNENTFPAGDLLDGPDYGIRGHMLDVGRHYYTAEYLTEICSYLSYFKMNEFHVHLSDQVSPSVETLWEEYYARFRLYSDKPAFTGLALKNESYDYVTFQKMQYDCAARGVTIVPEIESPGHALPLTQWQAEYFNTTIYRTDDHTLLNLSIPVATEVVEDIWTEFLPWFHSKEVSIGADEYPATLANDYITFVNTLNDVIYSNSGKSIRAWGTAEPSTTMNISKAVTIQHWALYDDDPVQVVDEGYPIINSQDWVFYEVMKYSTSYPPPINVTRLFDFGLPSAGIIWNTSLFNWTDIPHNPSPTTPLLRGAIAPVWNDNGPAASTDLEHYYESKDQIAVSASLSWGANGLTQPIYENVVQTLYTSAPAQNLARLVKSVGSTIIEYDFTASGLTDQSGNNYEARLSGSSYVTPQGLHLEDGSSLTTPLLSKGLNNTYTLMLSLSSPSTVFTLRGPDTALILQNGKPPTILSVPTNMLYPLRDATSNVTLPMSFGTATTITFATTELTGTEAWQNGVKIGNFNTPLSSYLNTTYYAWVQMALVAPINKVSVSGGEATLKYWKLEDGYAV